MKVPQTSRKNKWRDEFYVRSYELAKEGLSDAEIAGAVGVNPSAFSGWKQERPALKEAIVRGRERTTALSFERYSYGRLPRRLQAVWERLEAAEESAPAEYIESILAGYDNAELQRLWLHAFIRSNFRPDVACLRTGIDYKRMRGWLEDDPNFCQLVQEVRAARKDFIEGSLMDLVARHDVTAVVFANKTQNADRGYNPAKKLETTHIEKEVVDVNLIVQYLPVEVVGMVLEAIERAQAGAPKALPPKEVSDVG